MARGSRPPITLCDDPRCYSGASFTSPQFVLAASRDRGTSLQGPDLRSGELVRTVGAGVAEYQPSGSLKLELAASRHLGLCFRRRTRTSSALAHCETRETRACMFLKPAGGQNPEASRAPLLYRAAYKHAAKGRTDGEDGRRRSVKFARAVRDVRECWSMTMGSGASHLLFPVCIYRCV